MLCPADCAVVIWLQPVTLLAGQSASAMFVCLFVSVCVCCVRMCMCTRVHVYTCVRVCMCICMDVCVGNMLKEYLQ